MSEGTSVPKFAAGDEVRIRGVDDGPRMFVCCRTAELSASGMIYRVVWIHAGKAGNVEVPGVLLELVP